MLVRTIIHSDVQSAMTRWLRITREKGQGGKSIGSMRFDVGS